MKIITIITGSLKNLLNFISGKLSKFWDISRGIDDEEMIKIMKQIPETMKEIPKQSKATVKKGKVSMEFDRKK